jgi:hypothetical protein
VLFTHRKAQCKEQWNDCKSNHNKGGKALSGAAQNTSDFICNWEKQMNAGNNATVSFELAGELFVDHVVFGIKSEWRIG